MKTIEDVDPTEEVEEEEEEYLDFFNSAGVQCPLCGELMLYITKGLDGTFTAIDKNGHTMSVRKVPKNT